MTDIVERLRSKADVLSNPYRHYLKDAADEIERLRDGVMKATNTAYEDRAAKDAALKEVEQLRAEVNALSAKNHAGGAVIG